MVIQDMEAVWQCRFPKQSQRCHVISIKTKDRLMVQDIGIHSNQCWWKKCAYVVARDFSDEVWLQKIFEGSTKTRMENCKNKDGFFWFTSDSRAFCRYSNRTRIDGLCIYSSKLEKYIFHRGFSWNFHSVLGNRLVLGGKEKDKARQAVFPTQLNPFRNDPEEEEPHDDYTVPRKVLYASRWKHDQDVVFWIRLSKAKDQGLEFWQTKSFAIMTYATLPGDCIDRVTSQHEGRVNSKALKLQGRHPR